MTSSNTDSVSGFVDAGILLSFVSSTGTRSDMMSSTLLAQLAADKTLSRFTAPADWYDSYAKVLGNLAWQITGFKNQHYTPRGDTVTLEQIVLDVLSKVVSGSEVRLAQDCIRKFNRLPRENQGTLLYERFSRSSCIINLQVGVTNTSNILSVVGVVIKTKREIAGLFEEEIPASHLVGKIRTLFYRGNLNEKTYNLLRKGVIDKLGPKRDELIFDLNLA